VNFRSVIENWKSGPMKQFSFHFSNGAKYIIGNQQAPESTHREFFFRPQDPVVHETIWSVEIVVQHAFAFQALVILPQSQEAKLITAVMLAEIDSFVFIANAPYIDLRIADEPFGSAGGPALSGSWDC
jgi:hypothetical protein